MNEDGWARLNLRIPEDLKEWMREQAYLTHRSYNAMVVVAIERYRESYEKEAAAGSASQA